MGMMIGQGRWDSVAVSHVWGRQRGFGDQRRGQRRSICPWNGAHGWPAAGAVGMDLGGPQVETTICFAIAVAPADGVTVTVLLTVISPM